MFSDGLYKRVASHVRKNRTLYFLVGLILSACAVRLWFYSGLIFSDDAYYDQLAFSLYNGEYAEDYIGYPGFLLRILNHLLTAVSFFLFGANELSSMIPSFIFSVLTIPLIYKTSLALNSGVRGASIAAFLWAFFPLDIIFATFNFAEPKCALLLNLGAYLLLKSEQQNKIKLAWASGIIFYASLLLKEYFFFFSILLIGIFIFFLFKGEFKRTVFFSLTAFSILFLAHSLYYLYSKNDFFYYFTMLNENFRYAYYDFFPASAAKVFGGSDYFTLLIQQIILNIKYAFLRRHNMGLPLLGIALSIYSFVKKRNVISAYWFAGLSVIFIGFTTSISVYAPLNLHNSWNLYPLIFPLFLVIAAYAKSLKKEILYVLCAAYLIGGVYVSYKYKAFFDVDNKKELKTFIAQNADAEIYTDHHTRYGVDLIRSYEKGAHILLDEEQVRNIRKDGIVIYNKEVIDELKMQGHRYNINTGKLMQNQFILVKKFGSFEAYKKI